MEMYRYYPPQLRSTRMQYEVLSDGINGCQHELLDQDWCDRISVQDGLVVVTFSCKHCGRQIVQSLEEIVPPASWKGGNAHRKTPRNGNTVLVTT